MFIKEQLKVLDFLTRDKRTKTLLVEYTKLKYNTTLFRKLLHSGWYYVIRGYNVSDIKLCHSISGN